jgi:tRNA(Ile)-lysidine synthase
LRKNILKFLERFNLLTENQSIVVGVSGGSDSMSLIDFLFSLKNEKKIKLIAAHVNHMLRGIESDEDQKFVFDWCKNHDVEFKFIKINVLKLSKKTKKSIEDCAREVRYNFFKDLAKEFSSKIMTAHTLSDNVETFLLNLIRGSGTPGLTAIPMIRENIIRPFLFLSKDQIIEYCNTYNVKFRTDKSNFSFKYRRNKIRLDILPKLKQINPSFEKAVFRAIKSLKEDNDFLANLSFVSFKKAETSEGFLVKTLLKLEKPILSRVVILIVKKLLNLSPNEYQINQVIYILHKGCGMISFLKNKKLLADGGVLKVFEKISVKDWQIPFKSSNILTPTGKNIIIKIVGDKNKNNNLLDFNKIGDFVVFRNRRAGDVFFPVGRNGSKLLKKFLNEKKVNLKKRANLIVLADGKNILWVEGFGASQYVVTDLNSSKVVSIVIN